MKFERELSVHDAFMYYNKRGYFKLVVNGDEYQVYISKALYGSGVDIKVVDLDRNKTISIFCPEHSMKLLSITTIVTLNCGRNYYAEECEC